MFEKIVVVCLFCLFVDTYGKLPEYVKPCKQTNANLSQCWMNTINDLRPYLVKGIRELNVQPIDPLRIPKYNLVRENSRVAVFDAIFTDLSITGGKNFKIQSIKFDLDDVLFEIELLFPVLEIHLDYTVKGRVLLFNIDGGGDLDGSFTNVRLNITGKGNYVTRNNKKYIDWTEVTPKVLMEDIHLDVRGLYKDNPELTKRFNEVLNDNIRIIFQDFQGLAENTMGASISEAINWVHKTYPVDVLYPTK